MPKKHIGGKVYYFTKAQWATLYPTQTNSKDDAIKQVADELGVQSQPAEALKGNKYVVPKDQLPSPVPNEANPQFDNSMKDVYPDSSGFNKIHSKLSAEYDEWENSTTSTERNAVNWYTGNAYDSLNAKLRKADDINAVLLSAEQKLKTRQMTSALSKYELKNNIVVYRKSDDSLVGTSDYNKLKSMVGAVVRDDGFGSASPSQKVWWGNVYYRIEIPKGRGRGAWIAPISKHKTAELEFLMQRSSEYMVTGVTKTKGGTIVVKLRWIGVGLHE